MRSVALSLCLLLAASCAPFGSDFGREDTDINLDDEAPPKKKKSSASEEPPSSGGELPSAPPPASTTATCEGALFCDDFEASPKGNGQWKNFAPIGDDVLARTGPSAGAGAYSLGFIVMPGPEGRHSALSRELGDYGHVELTFALQIPPSFGEYHTNIAHLDFGAPGAPDLVVTIVGEQNRVGLVTKDGRRPLYAKVNDAALTPNTWHEVKLVVDIPGDPPTTHMEIDGVSVVDADVLDVPFSAPPPALLVLGPDYKKTTEMFEVRYDDVRVDARD